MLSDMVWEIKQGIDLVSHFRFQWIVFCPIYYQYSETMEGMLEGGYKIMKREGKQLIDIFSPYPLRNLAQHLLEDF